MKLGSSRGMDTKRPRGSDRSKPCHELQLTRCSQPPYPWPPEQAQSGVSNRTALQDLPSRPARRRLSATLHGANHGTNLDHMPSSQRERKSSEPVAARLQPVASGAHQSLQHFVANADWSQEPCRSRCEPLFCMRSIRAAGQEPGSSKARDSQRRAFIRSVSPSGIADNSASRTIVRSRTRCRQPTRTQGCRSPFGSTFPKIGQPTRFAGPEPACLRTSSSRPNRKSRTTRSAPRGA